MDKYKRYFGVIIFVAAIVLSLFAVISIISPKYAEWNDTRNQLATETTTLEQKRKVRANVISKLNKLHESVLTSQKKIYTPVEDKLGDDTLFFTLYSDLIEMVQANTIKVKSIDYEYNPEGDVFVAQNNSKYFVCDVNMEVVSNYVNLGKLIQDIYQYPYYIRINSIEVYPYPKDKTILLSSISLRLYAHTSPDEMNVIDGSTTPLPVE